ncbi:hypothetical protein AB0A77_33900 [Streptomyces varsoviensis]
MAEWIDPRYADLAEAWRMAQEQAAQADSKPPVRGFIVPSTEDHGES